MDIWRKWGMASLILTPDTTSSVLSASCCGRFNVVPTEQKVRCVPHSRPGRTGENTLTPPCRKAEHESTVAHFVGWGPPKSCASVRSSNRKHEALTGVTTKVVFFWDLALKMEAAVLSETLVLSYETIRLYIPEDSFCRRGGRMNSSPKINLLAPEFFFF